MTLETVHHFFIFPHVFLETESTIDLSTLQNVEAPCRGLVAYRKISRTGKVFVVSIALVNDALICRKM